MSCLSCLFWVAAGSMPATGVLLWTEGRRVNCYTFVWQENSPPQQLNHKPEYPWQLTVLSYSWWQKPWIHSLSLLHTHPKPKIALHVGRPVGKLYVTFKLAWIAHCYNNIIWSGLWVCSDWLSLLMALKMCLNPCLSNSGRVELSADQGYTDKSEHNHRFIISNLKSRIKQLCLAEATKGDRISNLS